MARERESSTRCRCRCLAPATALVALKGRTRAVLSAAEHARGRRKEPGTTELCRRAGGARAAAAALERESRRARSTGGREQRRASTWSTSRPASPIARHAPALRQSTTRYSIHASSIAATPSSGPCADSHSQHTLGSSLAQGGGIGSSSARARGEGPLPPVSPRVGSERTRAAQERSSKTRP